MGIDLGVMTAQYSAVQFYFRIHGLGPVAWMPVLVMPANEHTHHIIRETGPYRIEIIPESKSVPRSADDEGKRRIPPKVKAELIR